MYVIYIYMKILPRWIYAMLYIYIERERERKKERKREREG
jgi:hypothetical protein